MADNNTDSGSKDRATVALVDAKVDGLKELIRAEFGYIRERIEPISRLVLQQERSRQVEEDHERRITALEQYRKSDRDWKRVNLPSLIIAGVVALGSIVGVVTNLHIF